MKTLKLALLILCGSLALIFHSYAFAKDNKIVIRYAHQHPSVFSFYKGAEKFAQLVEENSNGRVKFEIYPASQLYRASEMVKAVTSGAVEMSHCVIDEWGLNFPLANIFMQPFMVRSEEIRKELTRGKIGKLIEQEMVKFGARPMFWMPHDFLDVFMNTKHPLKVPRDFKGLLIRVTPGSLEFTKALGATAVRMNVNDVYMALKRGTVNGVWTKCSSGTNRKWHEVAGYSTIVDMTTIYNVAFVNEKFWNSLPENIKKIMREAAAETESWVEGVALGYQDNAVEILKEKTDAYFPTAEEIKLWEAATLPVVEEFVKKGDELVRTAVKEVNRMKAQIKK